jgi:hypothetical protein
MDHFCLIQQRIHSENTCPYFINVIHHIFNESVQVDSIIKEFIGEIVEEEENAGHAS